LKNTDVREMATSKHVRLWQIAYELGITDGNFSRKLRKELAKEEKDHIYEIIDRLSREVH